MLVSNSNVSTHLKTIHSKVQSDFAKLDSLSATAEDIEALFTAYEMALTEQRNMYMQDLTFQLELKANPYITEYTYGHFLQLLKIRYLQAASLEEREMLRLKYYPLFNQSKNTTYDWKLAVDTLALQVNVDPSWVTSVMNLITLGRHKRRNMKLVKTVAVQDNAIDGTGLVTTTNL